MHKVRPLTDNGQKSLASLPVELQQEIIGLLQQQGVLKGSHEKYREDWKPLPIHETIPYLKDLLNLSSTCSWFRRLLGPIVFQTIYLHNTTISAQSVKKLSENEFSEYVKEIRYRGICNKEEVTKSLGDIFPTDVEDVLSNLGRFPNLETLSVDFPFDYEDLYAESLFQYQFEADPNDIMQAELNNAWRGLMSASYRAISGNTPQTHSHWDSFEIQGLYVVGISTFLTSTFHRFLSQLKKFKLTLQSWDNGAGWNLIAHEIFYGFPNQFPSWFYNHLSIVEEFCFDSADTSMLGDSNSSRACKIFLGNISMPMLRIFKIRNIFIGREFTDFLINNIANLESITLENCYGAKYSQDKPCPTSWAALFTDLKDKSPSQLKYLTLEFTDSKEQMLGLDNPREDPDVIQQINQNLQANQMVFGYGSMSDKYGSAYVDLTSTRMSLKDGVDAKAYRELMSLIDSNINHEE